MDGGSSILSSPSTTSSTNPTSTSAIVKNNNTKNGVNSALSLLELEGHSKESVTSKNSINGGAPTILEGEDGSNNVNNDKIKRPLSTTTGDGGEIINNNNNQESIMGNRQSSAINQKIGSKPVAAYTDMGLPNPEAYKDEFDERIDELEAADELRKNSDKDFMNVRHYDNVS